MDASAMEDHEWEDCGHEIAQLFKGDAIKMASIGDAWWNDVDEEDQELVHEFVCESKRGPDALAAVQRFEKYAQVREARMRKRREEVERKVAAATAERKKAVDTKAAEIAARSLADEFQKFRDLLTDSTSWAK